MKKNPETICVQGSYEPKSGDTRVLPLYQSTTYYYETADEMAHLFDTPKDGHIYSRISNPTCSALEEKVAMLEGGVGAMACSSGMAAELMMIMTLCQTGDNFLFSSAVYGGTHNLFNITVRKLGIEGRMFDQEADSSEIEKLIDSKTKFIFGETIANPAMNVLDFDKISAIAKKHELVFAVDNTLATPVLVRPFEHGANIIIHSSTKYMDGHAAAVGGLLVDGGNFNYDGNPRYSDFYTPDESYHGVIYVKEGGAAAFILKARMQNMRDTGAIMSPFNAYLTHLGMETLHLRMQRHSQNAAAIAEALSKHKNVEWVRYPSLSTDIHHERAKKYFEGGFSGMIAFSVKGGREKAAQFISNLKLFKQVTHIADVRSCVLHPATTTHRQLSAEDLIACGISDSLIRLSAGIEATEDVVTDIIQALDNI